MKILVVLPCFGHGWILKQTIKRWSGADLFVIQDNSQCDVIDVFKELNITPNIITDEDWYVNKCWNAGMKYFLESDYDLICLATMDTWMRDNWKAILEHNYNPLSDEVVLPDFVTEGDLKMEELNQSVPYCERFLRTSGTGNFATFFNRKAVELFYPIPDEIKLWYGDEWIFTILRNIGFKTVTYTQLYAYQFGSITVNQNTKAFDVIQHDKEAWESSVKNKMIDKINYNANR
ncbi:MAG: hypothetical protein V4549_06635 [Bacteroidota bacterium]